MKSKTKNRCRQSFKDSTNHSRENPVVAVNHSKIRRILITKSLFLTGWPNGSDMKNSYGEELEAIMNPGDMLYFPAGMWHSVETIEEGILINISLMSVNYASLDSLES